MTEEEEIVPLHEGKIFAQIRKADWPLEKQLLSASFEDSLSYHQTFRIKDFTGAFTSIHHWNYPTRKRLDNRHSSQDWKYTGFSHFKCIRKFHNFHKTFTCRLRINLKINQILPKKIIEGIAQCALKTSNFVRLHKQQDVEQQPLILNVENVTEKLVTVGPVSNLCPRFLGLIRSKLRVASCQGVHPMALRHYGYVLYSDECHRLGYSGRLRRSCLYCLRANRKYKCKSSVVTKCLSTEHLLSE